VLLQPRRLPCRLYKCAHRHRNTLWNVLDLAERQLGALQAGAAGAGTPLE